MKKLKIAAVLLAGMLISACGTDIPAPAEPAAKSEAPQSAQPLGLPDSAVWNPDLGEWYDSDYRAWDTDAQQYVHVSTAEAVAAEGEAPEAARIAKLQEQYGFLIAPALRDLGQLGLLQIPADAPCTDAEQLAAFAEMFA